jgi:hypothetical protein
MYSEVVNGLGLSQNTLEIMVLIGIGIFICGAILVLFWKHIIVGALALSCVVVMANHKSSVSKQKVEPVIEKKEEVINQVKPVEPLVNLDDLNTSKIKSIPSGVQPTPPKTEEPKDVRSEFMEKCINLADYTRTQCDELWDDRVKEERAILEDTKHKGKTNGHYRKV